MTDDARFSPAIRRLFDFVHRVHEYGVRNPDSGFTGLFGTPMAIGDINSILRAGRYNSTRATIRSDKPKIKRKRRICS